MTRPLRILFPGATYHIVARGNERTNIFTSDEDRKRFLSLLERGFNRYKFSLHCYVLMNNHYHLLLESKEANLNQIMHYLNTAYTVYFNHRYKRVGHLFQGRYKAILIDKETYLLEVSRYLHLNPVRSKLANHPEDYRWSSYRAYIGLDRNIPNYLEISWILGQFSSELKEAFKLYKNFVDEGVDKKLRNPFKDVYAQTVLGREDFIERLKDKLDSLKRNSEIPAIRELKKLPTPEDIIYKISKYFNISEEEIKKAHKKNFIPRLIAIYYLREKTELSLVEIGKYFNVTYSAVSQIVKRIKEERKKEEKLQKILDELENLNVKI